MSRARLGRKLEDAIAAYVTAQKGTYLSGCTVYPANSASVVDVPYIVVWTAVTQPQGGPEESGMHGPQRAVVKLRITEHKTGTLIGQWADELAEILSRRLRFGYIYANTTASASCAIVTGSDTGKVPAAGDEIVIGETNYTITAASLVGGSSPARYSVTLNTAATLTAGTAARHDNPANRPEEFTQLIAAMNVGGNQHPETGLHVTRIAFVDESSGVDEDCRTWEYSFEIDAQPFDEPAI